MSATQYFCLSNALDRPSNKHNYVLSNAGLSNAPTITGICTSLKSTIEYKVGTTEFYLYMAFGIHLLKFGEHSLKTAEIGIRTPLKLANYFRFVSQRIGVEATTFVSRMQNLVKIGK